MTGPDRTTVGRIMRRHGAYLVSLAGTGSDDLTPDEMFDAASSVSAARRVLRAMATRHGCTHLRWSETDTFVLRGVWPDQADPW